MLLGATLAAILFFCLWRLERIKADRALAGAGQLAIKLGQERQHMNALTGQLLELDGEVKSMAEEHAQLALTLHKDCAFLRERPELAVYLNRNNSLYCALRKIVRARSGTPPTGVSGSGG